MFEAVWSSTSIFPNDLTSSLPPFFCVRSPTEISAKLIWMAWKGRSSEARHLEIQDIQSSWALNEAPLAVGQLRGRRRGKLVGS